MRIYKIANKLNSQDSKGYLYHGTSRGAALGIQRKGHMEPHNVGEIKPSISFSKSLDYAKYYASAKGGTNNAVIIRTLQNDEFFTSERIPDNDGYEYITFNPIPVNRLEILTYEGIWKPLESWDVVFGEDKQ